jgi:hypothetical protein
VRVVGAAAVDREVIRLIVSLKRMHNLGDDVLPRTPTDTMNGRQAEHHARHLVEHVEAAELAAGSPGLSPPPTLCWPNVST